MNDVTAHPIPAAALDDRMAFIGTSGSGKTYAAGTAVERLLASGARVVIIDPLDVWWGLRSSVDGASPSPHDIVILGGTHGDLELREDAGALLGAVVARSSQSCIVSLGGLPTKAAERRFMRAFLESVYEKASGEPVHLIFDEADLWAPQRALGETAVLLGRMEEIIRRGRVKGFIPWLITQRPAVIAKDVLSQMDGMVAMKLTGPHDRKAIGDWIGAAVAPELKASILDPLAGFARGQGILWVPARDILAPVTFPAKTTFDSSRTPTRGEPRRVAALAPIDLAAIRAAIEANSVAEAGRQPNPKKGPICQPAIPVPSEAILAEAERRGFERGVGHGIRVGWANAAAACQKAMEGIQIPNLPALALVPTLVKVAIENGAGGDPSWPASVTGKTAETTAKPKADYSEKYSSTPKPAPPKASNTNGVAPSLTGPQRELLRALAWWRAMGHAAPSRTQVAAIAGWKSKGSNLRNRLSELSAAGLVDYPTSGFVALSSLGAAAAPEPDLGRTLIDSVRGALTGPQAALFDELLRRKKSVARADLAAAIGWANGSNLRNRLSELSALELVDYPAKGVVALQKWVRGEEA